MSDTRDGSHRQELESGRALTAAELLPLVYDELRRLAALQLRREAEGHTLQPTALVHEAYLRLADQQGAARWNHRGHFYAAAAEAMRRILVEHARRKGRQKRGADWQRLALPPAELAAATPRDDLVAISEAIERLEQVDARKAALVKLRYFAGLKMTEAAEALGVSVATAERDWAYARAWLLRELCPDEAS